jgi:hypothetical protein
VDEPDGARDGDVTDAAMWHVTLTVAGDGVEPSVIRAALERLSHEHPFLLNGRYAADRAEVSYWEEAIDVADAAILALRLWETHRASAGLPEWDIVGLEVVDRGTFQRRGHAGELAVRLVPAGAVRPF